MLLNKTHVNVGIILFVMGIALVTFGYPYQLQNALNIVRGLQLTATVVGLFGILKKDPLHKDVLLLFWLAFSTFFFAVLNFCSLNYIAQDFRSYNFWSFLGSLMILLCEWIAAAVVGFAIYLMYLEYVELTENNRRTGLTISGVNQMSPTVETKEFPPPYIVPTSENMTVTVQR